MVTRLSVRQSGSGKLPSGCKPSETLRIIASAIVTWLIAFDVISTENPQTANLVRLLGKVTDPVYKPLRKYIPPIGGIDITPIIVIIILALIDHLLAVVLLSYAAPVVVTR